MENRDFNLFLANLSGLSMKDATMMVDDNVISGITSTLKKEYVNQKLKELGVEIKELTEKNGKHYYYVQKKTKDLKIYVKGATLDSLYEKLFAMFNEDKEDYSFKSMFDKAIERKALQNNSANNISSSNTIKKDKANYNRFITDEFGGRDIRKLTDENVKDYVIETLQRLAEKDGKKLTEKAFLSFKGILNMAFSYADSKDICVNFIANQNKFNNSDFNKHFDKSVKKAQNKAYSPSQIDKIKDVVVARIADSKTKGECYTNGFIFLLSANTGMRSAELVALKWSDIDLENLQIHIHSQQLKKQGTRDYEYVLWTKNEKGISNDGRYFPITDEVMEILKELKKCQELANIRSEWVFANEDGSWVKADTMYEKFLQRISNSLGFLKSNNHAIRIYFNSYVLVPNGVTVNNRAKLLGHSVEVNLKNYTFEDYDYCDTARDALNGSFRGVKGSKENVVDFSNKKLSKAFI